ncbi:MAG: hypothetical protein QT03_C0001G0676 [archaeon GW2011_AR10]|nr:MAG: hypothetical protein QT03_C0001G0676 [archaeon GW2011_AR10]
MHDVMKTQKWRVALYTMEVFFRDHPVKPIYAIPLKEPRELTFFTELF